MKTIEAMLASFSHVENSDDPKARKEQRILRAAGKLFEKYGYRKTSMDEVAREAGVAKGTLYLYFKTKADLMVQVIVQEKMRYMGGLKPVFEEKDPRARLMKYMEFAMTLGTRMPITSGLMRGDKDLVGLLDEMDEDVRARSDEFVTLFMSSIIAAACAPAILSPAQMAERVTVLKGVLYFAGQMADERISGDMGIDRFAHILSGMLLPGLVAPGETKGESE